MSLVILSRVPELPPVEPLVPQSASIAAYRRQQEQRVLTAPGTVRPVILIPTQRQRDAGRTLIDATEAQQPSACRRLAAVARKAGYAVRVTFSSALVPPGRGGEDWAQTDTVALRFHRGDGVSGYAVWRDGKWHEGRVSRAGRTAKIGARELPALLAEPVLDINNAST